MVRLDGKVALVTGGGRGIGRATALALAARGAAVVVCGRDEKSLGETVGEIAHGGGKARHLAGDVRDPLHLDAAVARAVDTFGGLHVVVANAGLSGKVELGGDLGRAEAILQTNLLGAYYTFHASVPKLGAGGRLLAMSSVLGKFGVAGQAAYCASKAGLHGLVRATALEVAPRGITCNAIVPGWVETEMAESRFAEIAAGEGTTPERAKEAAARAVPLGRLLRPEEIADFVVFLCSPAADNITGQALSICGGVTAFGA